MSLEDSIRRDLPNPGNFLHAAYDSYVVGANDAMRLRLKQFFEEIDIDEFIRSEISLRGGNGLKMQYCICNIGSDGRCEKGPTSPHDILILSKYDDLAPTGSLQKALEMKFKNLFVRQNELVLSHDLHRYAPGAHRVFSDFEAKSLSNSDIMYGYKQKPEASWPSRIFDADVVMPNGKGLLREAKRKLAIELREKNNGKLGHSIRSKEKDRLKDHARLTKTGINTFKGQTVQHFDLEQGTATYRLSEEISGISATSFKQGPLRLIQTAVVLRLIDVIRSEEFTVDSADELLSEMETQTTRKLSYLHALGLSKIHPGVMAGIIDNYKYFLWLFHQSEYAYYADKQTKILFQKQEVKERIHDIPLQLQEFVNDGKPTKQDAIVLA
jgi:hypothetical protein